MSQRRRKPPSSPRLSGAPSADDDGLTPLGYVLEWTPRSHHHRHRLDTVDNLRSELLGGEPAGVEQLIVLRGGPDLVGAGSSRPDDDGAGGVSDALRNLAGVDAAFLEAFARGGAKPFRPRGRARTACWWTWRYPEQSTTTRDGNDGPSSSSSSSFVVMRHAALWLSSPTPILLVDTPLDPAASRRRDKPAAPRLRHQDAATRRSGLQHGMASGDGGGRYGSMARYHTSPRPQADSSSSSSGKPGGRPAPAPAWALDDELAAAVDHVQDVALDEMLAEIVYERWAAYLGALRLDGDGAGDVDVDGGRAARRLLWSYMVALERNLDDARCCARQGRFVEHASPAAWTDLSQRAQLRIQLASAASATSSITNRRRHHHHRRRRDEEEEEGEEKDGAAPRRGGGGDEGDAANERSLDRIAYLGGVLLPVTVVAGVLAIEGRYGPEGPQFWVFWAASAAASVAALLVIYLDQLRLADVWVEMPSMVEAGGGGGDGGGFGLGGVVDDGGGKLVAAATARRRAWHRERMGWARAMKRATGYYRLRGARWIRFQSPANEEGRGREEDIIVVHEE
ncbi:hypothetical protein IF1G_01676 [Cordyceps javanica]|uniref:Uncharacterized protein n=1 Tax=Cordyceps javanica TaxID=43265 RepID=A0A545VCK1_9HYPO|nr:hypothetical protein IF1G_01676 [Cordyceps javanica]TQW10861.1 hypothetical protein IF2G_01803 [Cordyceps javanica]